MMSYFNEIAEIAKQARANWIKRDDAAIKALSQFYKGFSDYCEIPSGSMKLMPWDKDEKVFKAEEGFFGIPHAMHRDEKADEWSIGISVKFNPLNESPPLSVWFGVFVTEKDGKFFFRTGSTSKRAVDLNNKADADDFFASVVTEIKQAFQNSNKSQEAKHGFRFDVGY